MKIKFIGVKLNTYYTGIAILCPKQFDYGREFATGEYVKAVSYYLNGNGVYEIGKIVKCKLYSNNKGTYFIKYGNRYYLDNILKCDIDVECVYQP